MMSRLILYNAYLALLQRELLRIYNYTLLTEAGRRRRLTDYVKITKQVSAGTVYMGGPERINEDR